MVGCFLALGGVGRGALLGVGGSVALWGWVWWLVGPSGSGGYFACGGSGGALLAVVRVVASYLV